MSDAMAILGMDAGPSGTGPGGEKKVRKPRRDRDPAFKRPEGMHRELYALLCDDGQPPPIMGTGVSVSAGYKNTKASFGMRKVRPWHQVLFTNPARKDGLQLLHWRRKSDNREFPFAQFNKTMTLVHYNEAEYKMHLQDAGWTKGETDHLFSQIQRFGMKFNVIRDRWDRERFRTDRSIEDMKDRFYKVSNIMNRFRNANLPDDKLYKYNIDHEKKRKEQVNKIYFRTPEQIQEYEILQIEMKNAEQRKKEREKKTQDLQKLIRAADVTEVTKQQQPPIQSKSHSRNPSSSSSRRRNPTGSSRDRGKEASSVNTVQMAEAGIKFPDIKNPGPYLRSLKMKLPGSVGQKKAKAIDQLLGELNVDLKPMPSEEIIKNFNDLRSEMVLLYELKQALTNVQFDMQTLKIQVDPTSDGSPDQPMELDEPSPQQQEPGQVTDPMTPAVETPAPEGQKDNANRGISELLDLGSSSNRRRKAAIGQKEFLTKVKKAS